MIHPKVKERKFPLDAKAIGERIGNARRWKGWRQRDLAEVLGLKKNTVANWEGGWRVPPLRTMVQLSVHLRRSMDWLIGGVPRRGSLWGMVAPLRRSSGRRLLSGDRKPSKETSKENDGDGVYEGHPGCGG